MTGHTATVRHPHVLHAMATAWSLLQARARLNLAVEREAASADAEASFVAPADGLRGCAAGSIRSGGGHGDPTGSAVLYRVQPATQPATPPRPAAALATSTTNTLTWLADTLRAGTGPDPIWRLIDALPSMRPATAAHVQHWMAADDTRIRTALGMGPDEQLLPGAECPGCQGRPLYARTAAPDPADWVVTCPAGCLCVGQGCGCGMLVTVEGVSHIWDRGTPAIATALDRWLTPRRYVLGMAGQGHDGPNEGVAA